MLGQSVPVLLDPLDECGTLGAALRSVVTRRRGAADPVEEGGEVHPGLQRVISELLQSGLRDADELLARVPPVQLGPAVQGLGQRLEYGPATLRRDEQQGGAQVLFG